MPEKVKIVNFALILFYMFYNKIVKKEAYVATYVIYILCENICKYEYI